MAWVIFKKTSILLDGGIKEKFMTLKQIKFNPFKHWGIISDLYKQSFPKEERIPFFGLGSYHWEKWIYTVSLSHSWIRRWLCSYEPDRATNSIRLSGYLWQFLFWTWRCINLFDKLIKRTLPKLYWTKKLSNWEKNKSFGL